MNTERCRPFHGLEQNSLRLILGLAPQALCFRPLRGLRPTQLTATKLPQFIETIASFVV